MKGHSGNAGFLARVAFCLLFAGFLFAGCAPLLSPPRHPAGDKGPVAVAKVAAPSRARPSTRPDIPDDWSPGKRIVMRVTPSLAQSYTLSCEVPIPAWDYLKRGHRVTILVDSEAVTAFRRDGSGKTPLDRLDLLEDDLDEMAALLKLRRPAIPKSFGDLFRFLASKGVRIVANGEALRALRIEPSELDPIVSILDGSEVQKLTTDLDALLPYEEIGVPFEPLFPKKAHEMAHPH